MHTFAWARVLVLLCRATRYFSWVDFMTSWMFVPAVAGIVLYFARMYNGDTIDDCVLTPYVMCRLTEPIDCSPRRIVPSSRMAVEADLRACACACACARWQASACGGWTCSCSPVLFSHGCFFVLLVCLCRARWRVYPTYFCADRFYGLFVYFWAVTLLRFYEQHEARISWQWGTYVDSRLQADTHNVDIRPEFDGTMRTSPVTGQREKYFSPTRRLGRLVC